MGLKDRKKRNELMQKLRSIDNYYDPMIEDSTGDERDSLENAHFSDSLEYNSELQYLDQQHLFRKARKFAIDILPDWLEHDVYRDKQLRNLTSTGERELRKAIKKANRENIEWWVKIISPLLSLLIALAGVVTAILSLKYKK